MAIMNKIIGIVSLLVMIMLLAGCSLSAYKPSVSKVEAVARECINENIKRSSNKITKGKDNASVYYIYHMVDDRGVEFDLKLHTDYVVFVEPIPPFLSNYRKFYTDYPAKVVEYYESDIDNILQLECVQNYKIFPGHIEVEFVSGTDYSEIASVILEIDNLLAFDYKCGGISQIKPESDTKTYWSGVSKASISVKISGDNEEKTSYALYKVFTFSTNSGNELSYEYIMEELNSYEVK